MLAPFSYEVNITTGPLPPPRCGSSGGRGGMARGTRRLRRLLSPASPRGGPVQGVRPHHDRRAEEEDAQHRVHAVVEDRGQTYRDGQAQPSRPPCVVRLRQRQEARHRAHQRRHWNDRQRHTQRGREPAASAKAKEHRVQVAQHRGDPWDETPRALQSQQVRGHHRQDALARVAQQGERAGDASDGAKDVGGPGIPRAQCEDVLAPGAGHQVGRRKGPQEVPQGHGQRKAKGVAHAGGPFGSSSAR